MCGLIIYATSTLTLELIQVNCEQYLPLVLPILFEYPNITKDIELVAELPLQDREEKIVFEYSNINFS